MSDLSDFFQSISVAKKQQKEELESILGPSFLDELCETVVVDLKTTKKKEKQQKQNLQIFEHLVEEISETISDDKEETAEVIGVVEEPEKLVEKFLGLLAEPSDVKVQQDPLTPLDQKFATLDDLQKHYSTFLSRIQQQLSTIGGGGETNLAYMDMPLTYVTTSTYTIKPQDYYIGINYAGAVTITLPTPRKNGKTYIVKDERGEASKGANRHIYIYPSGSDLIDEEDYAILAYDYGSLTFVYRNGWRVV